MTVLRYAAVALSVIVTLFSSAVWALMLPADFPAAVTFACIGLSGIVAAFAANAIFYKKLRAAPKKDLQKDRKKAVLTLWSCRAYSLLLLLFGYFLSLGISGLLLCLVSSAMQDRVGATFLCLLMSVALYLLTMFIPLMTLVRTPPVQETDDKERVTRMQAPLLYEIADRAAVVAKYRKNYFLTRAFGPATQFEAQCVRGGIAVSLPIATLSLFTKEELFGRFLYVFARAAHRDSALLNKLALARFRYDCEKDKLGTLKILFFCYPDALLRQTEEGFALSAGERIQQAAQAAAIGVGAQAYIDGFVKCRFAADLFRSPCPAVEYEPFAEQSPVQDYYERMGRYLEGAIKREEPHLRAVLLRSLEERAQFLPTLEQLQRQANVSCYDLSRREKNSALINEVTAEIARCSRYALESFRLEGVWDSMREEYYLSVNRVIEEYERAQQTGTADEYLCTQALQAYLVSHPAKVFDVAERALAERAMRTDAEKVSAIWLCRKDHPAAVDAALHVVQDNPLLVPELVPVLETAALRTGDEQVIQNVENALPPLRQVFSDYQKELADMRVTPDTLFPCDLPQARLAHIGAVLLRLNGRSHSYLVRVRTFRYAVYAVFVEDENTDEGAYALIADYLASITRPEETYILCRERAASPTMAMAQRMGICLT